LEEFLAETVKNPRKKRFEIWHVHRRGRQTQQRHPSTTVTKSVIAKAEIDDKHVSLVKRFSMKPTKRLEGAPQEGQGTFYLTERRIVINGSTF
jgi:hypothetical protein